MTFRERQHRDAIDRAHFEMAQEIKREVAPAPARVIGFDEPIERIHRNHPDRFDVPSAMLERKLRAELTGTQGSRISMTEIAYSTLLPRNADRGLKPTDKMRIFTAALAQNNSDFPSMTSSVLWKFFLGFMATFVRSFSKLTRTIDLRDFRETPGLTLHLPDLEGVNEHGEFRTIVVHDYSEPLALETKGGIFGLTLAAMVNDDTRAMLDVPRAAAESVRSTQNNLLWDFVQSGASSNGPTCADGVQFFHATHANLMTGSTVDETNVGLALAAMRGQRALDSVTPMGIAPAFIVVPPSLELAARKVATVVGLDLEVIVEPLINGGAWYVFADPAKHPAFLHGRLYGEDARLETRTGFEIDGIDFRVIVDVGIGAGNCRAAVRNPGA